MLSRRILSLSQSVINAHSRPAKILLRDALIFNHSHCRVQQCIRSLASDVTKTKQTDLLKDFVIPDPPLPPELLPLAPITLKTFSFSYLLPTGWICSMLLFCENYMPYYVAIIAATVVGRIILTPVMIFAHKQSAKMAIVNPQIAAIQKQKNEAELRGDKDEVFKSMFKLAEVYKSTDAFKIKNMALSPVCTMAVFGSFFICLRRMANAGHEAMKEGGIGPFIDLTIPDTSYLLPTLTAVSLYGIMKIGIEFGSITTQAGSTPMQNLLKQASLFAVPAVIFYATSKMPSAIGLYWASSNAISMLQTLIMLNPSLRASLGIPPTIPKPKAAKRGIIGGARQSWIEIKEAWDSMIKDRKARKISKEYMNQFDRSGVGPLQKTYDYDPTKKSNKLKLKS